MDEADEVLRVEAAIASASEYVTYSRQGGGEADNVGEGVEEWQQVLSRTVVYAE